jgi:BlaI family penicillinase repressor
MKGIKISEAEWEVMTALWQRGPMPAAEVVQTLTERKGWHSRTIRTLLDRLLKKQAVKIRADGKRNVYEARISMEQALRQESRTFAQRLFGGEPVSMLLHLVGQTELSKEDIKKLKEILKEKEK